METKKSDVGDHKIQDEPEDELDVDHDCTIPHSEPMGGTGSLESALADEKNRIKRILKLLGPGLITGASDDDPSGIGTYTTAGASLGFATLWTAPLTFPLMLAVQCAATTLARCSFRQYLRSS